MRRRFSLMPLVVLFGGALAWAGGTTGSVHAPFLFNRTLGTADVRITWVLRRVPCATGPEELAGSLGPSDLDDPRTVTLGSGETAALNGPPPAGTAPVGVCATSSTGSSSNQDCRAAILESAGITPVVMVAPSSWLVFGDGYICTPGPSTKSRCAPKLDPAVDGGDDALSLTAGNGGAFLVSRAGGPVDRSIRIAPVDPAAIAARPAATDGCRQARDAYRALAQSTACTVDADCQAIPGLAIPGEAGTCALFVNTTVSSAELEAVRAQWATAQCASVGPCVAPLGVVCRAGACGELCAGVALPTCDPSCDAYASDPNGVCGTLTFGCSGSSEQCHPICTDANRQRCVCKNNDTVVCQTQALVDPTCPLPCRR